MQTTGLLDWTLAEAVSPSDATEESESASKLAHSQKVKLWPPLE